MRNRNKRAKVQRAYDYLMSHEAESSYKDFVKKHDKFLRNNPNATDSDCKRSLQFIETVGLECALWPSLYWCTEMCETTERATDSRRVAAAAGAARNAAFSDEEDEEHPGEGSGRHSIKRSFMRKVLSPIIGYGQDFELLQFIYDLTMWSRIGGGKNACAGMPLRLVLKGETFSPLYWKSKHQALIDMQRQCGFPALFKTMAPWEHSFPYHIFVLDEMEKGGRVRTQLARLETLHAAHVFTELNRGLYSGLNKTSAQDDHLLASTQPEEGRVKTVINHFQRLEFQDGKRKLPTQDYHGSGRVHVHSLHYLQNVVHIGLERKLAATVPDVAEQPALRGYMLGRPHGRSDSGWPVEDGESRWDPDENIVRLRHTEADKEQGHRAFFPETLEVTKCHQDVLHGNGQGLLLRYVATYTPKFSDSFAREWLNDEASARHVGSSSTTSLQSQKCGSTFTRSRCRAAATAVRWFLSSRRGLAWRRCQRWLKLMRNAPGAARTWPCWSAARPTRTGRSRSGWSSFIRPRATGRQQTMQPPGSANYTPSPMSAP